MGRAAEARREQREQRKGPGSLIGFDALQQKRVQKVLGATVRVRNRWNVGLEELFSPASNAVVVLRGANGTRLDPLDFNTDGRRQQKGRRRRGKRP